MPPIGAQPERPRDLEERDAVELLDTTATWNAAIEAALECTNQILSRYPKSQRARSDESEGAYTALLGSAHAIRALRRPVAPSPKEQGIS